MFPLNKNEDKNYSSWLIYTLRKILILDGENETEIFFIKKKFYNFTPVFISKYIGKWKLILSKQWLNQFTLKF